MNSANKVLKQIKKRTNTIGIELTTYCPLSCKYCVRHMLERKNRELKWDDFLIIKDKISGFDRVVICGMGEPMVYSHIYDVLAELKDKKIIIITSGTVLIDFNRLNANKNVEVVVFSVDEPTEAGMREIAGNYNWSNLLSNLNNARRVARIINCTVTQDNYRNIPELARFAVKYRVNAISYTLDIRRSESTIFENINKLLAEAEETARKGRLVFTDSFTHLKCMGWGNVVPYLNLDGELFPCCQGVNRQLSIGNIFSQNYDEIWESEGYRKFREGNLCRFDCPIYNDKESRSREADNNEEH